MTCPELATKQDLADLRRDILHALKYGEVPDPEPKPDPFDPYGDSDVIPAAIPAAIGLVPLLKGFLVWFAKYAPAIAAVVGFGGVVSQIKDFLLGGKIDERFDSVEGILTNGIKVDIANGFDAISKRLDAFGVPALEDVVPQDIVDSPAASSGNTLDRPTANTMLNALELRLREYINGHHWGTKSAILDALKAPFPEADYSGITNAVNGIKAALSQEIKSAIGSISTPDFSANFSGLNELIVRQHIDTRGAISGIKFPSIPEVDLSGVTNDIRALGNQIANSNPLGEISNQLLTQRTVILGAISGGYADIKNTISAQLGGLARSADLGTLATHVTQQHIATRTAFPNIDYANFPSVDYSRISDLISRAHGTTRTHVTSQVGGIDMLGFVNGVKDKVVEDGNLTRTDIKKINLTTTETNITKHQTEVKTAIITEVRDCCFTMDYGKINDVTTDQGERVRDHVSGMWNLAGWIAEKAVIIEAIDRKNEENLKDAIMKICDKLEDLDEEIKQYLDEKHKDTKKHVDDKAEPFEDKVDEIYEAVGVKELPLKITDGKRRSYDLETIPAILQNLIGRLGLNKFPKKYIDIPLEGDKTKKKEVEIASLGSLIEMIGEAVYAPFFPVRLPAQGFKFLEGIPAGGLPKNKYLDVHNSGHYIQWLSNRMSEIPISQFGGDPDDAKKLGDVYLRTCKITLRENHTKDDPSQVPFKNKNGGPARYYSISLKHLKPGLTWKDFKDVFTDWKWGPFVIEAVLESKYTINFRSGDKEGGVRAMKRVIARLIDEEAVKITATYEEVHPSIEKEPKTVYLEELIVTLKKESKKGKIKDVVGKKYVSERIRVSMWPKKMPYGTPRTLTDYITI